jgi:hypothetical protein
MGVIYSVVLEVRPQYFLAETTSQTTWNTLLTTPGAITSLRTNRFLEIVVFPFADGSGDRTCYTVTRTEVPVDSPVTEGGGGFDPLGFLCSAPSPVFTGILAGMIIGLAAAIAPLLAIPIIGPVLAAGDILVMTLLTSVVLTSVATTVAGIANALSTLGGPFIGMAVTLTNSLLTTGLSTPFRQDVSYKIMDTQNYGESNCDYKALSLEVAFDADNTTYQDFLQALFGQIDSFLANSKLYGGYISLRYCGGSDALLGIEQWPHTVCIELAMLQGLNYAMEILTSFKTLAVETFGATLHWGQLNDLSRSDVERSYPKKIDAWRRVLARLARRGSLNTFDNSFCSSHGLEVYATRPVDVSYLVPLLLSK